MDNQSGSTDTTDPKGASPATVNAILASVATTIYLSGQAPEGANYSALALTNDEYQTIAAQDSAQS